MLITDSSTQMLIPPWQYTGPSSRPIFTFLQHCSTASYAKCCNSL